MEPREHVRSLVVRLTTGQKSLEPSLVAELKNVCRASKTNVGHAWEILFGKLHSQNSRIRHTTLLIVDVLFRRSSEFRRLLVLSLKSFIHLTIAKQLRQTAVRLIEEWYQQFGKHYSQLTIGYKHLLASTKIRFPSQVAAEQKRKEEARRKIWRRRLSLVRNDMQRRMPEIGSLLLQMKCGFEALADSEKLFDGAEQEGGEEMAAPEHGPSEQDMRSHGLHSSYELDIELDTAAEKTSGNVAVLEHLQECAGQLRKARSALHRWHLMTSRASGSQAAEMNAEIKRTMDQLDAVMATAREVGVPMTKDGSVELDEAGEETFSDEEEDDDLEEWDAGEGLYIELDDVVRQLDGADDLVPAALDALPKPGMEYGFLGDIDELEEVGTTEELLERPKKPLMQGRKRMFENGQSLPRAEEEPPSKKTRRGLGV